jgi:catechol 2,3-dioxygenase-like lactoylglutathione lyase family enzyme
MSANVSIPDNHQIASTGVKPASRLHHHAFVVADQEKTRHFYEDIVGLPLRATWVEHTPHEGDELVYCHTFFGLADGGALAFFNFADASLQAKFTSPQPGMFYHVALKTDEENQAAIHQRCKAAKIDTFEFDHGYCRSLYVRDPDGLLVEFTVDPPDVDQINAMQERIAHQTLAAWQRGDRTPNNSIRPHG